MRADPPVTAGREQDARETVEYVPPVLCPACERGWVPPQIAVVVRAALLPSPPATTGAGDEHVAAALARRLTIAKNDLHDETARADALALQVQTLLAARDAAASSLPATDGDAADGGTR